MRLIGLVVVLTLGLLAAPLAAGAQPAAKVYRIGFLGHTTPTQQSASSWMPWERYGEPGN